MDEMTENFASAASSIRHVPVDRARHFTFARPIEAAIVREAQRRGVSPTSLASAIVRTAIEDDLLTAIFDDRPVEELATPRAADSAGLTPIQASLLLVIAHHCHSAKGGIAALNGEQLAELIDVRSPSTAHRLRNVLAEMGLITLLRREHSGLVQRFTLTDTGWKIARELAAGGSCATGT